MPTIDVTSIHLCVVIVLSINLGSQASIMTKVSEDDCSNNEKKDGENDGTISNDPDHPLLKVRYQ